MIKYIFSFEGRIRRRTYGVSLIFYLICYFTLLSYITDGDVMEVFMAYSILLPLVWFIWAQGAKRCHDIGKSGWYQLIPFYFLWMLLAPGVAGPNEFDPKSDPQENESKPVVIPDHSRPDGAPPQQPDASR